MFFTLRIQDIMSKWLTVKRTAYITFLMILVNIILKIIAEFFSKNAMLLYYALIISIEPILIILMIICSFWSLGRKMRLKDKIFYILLLLINAILFTLESFEIDKI